MPNSPRFLPSIIHAFLFFQILFSSLETTFAAAPKNLRTISSRDQILPQTQSSKILSVISWNVKKLGRPKMDLTSVVSLLGSADIVTFQEVNSRETGNLAVLQLAKKLQSITNEKICTGLSEIPSGSKERYAYIWRNTRVAYVKTNGEILMDCPITAITIRLGAKNKSTIVREPAFGTFHLKADKKNFVLASIHLVPTKKSPEKEVPPLFETFHDVDGPVIIAGDYNLDSTNRSFSSARRLNFSPVFESVPTSLKRNKRLLNKAYDNFWYREAEFGHATVLNLYEIFSNVSTKNIYNDISDHSPIYAEFLLRSAKPRLGSSEK